MIVKQNYIMSWIYVNSVKNRHLHGHMILIILMVNTVKLIKLTSGMYWRKNTVNKIKLDVDVKILFKRAVG